jgi:hypothetical protein
MSVTQHGGSPSGALLLVPTGKHAPSHANRLVAGAAAIDNTGTTDPHRSQTTERFETRGAHSNDGHERSRRLSIAHLQPHCRSHQRAEGLC